MSDVSVIGTGAMGSALVEVLATSGAEVTVWNRTDTKAAALAGPQVRVARSVGETIASSPLVIVSVANHEVARSLVSEAGEDLTGKVVASTSLVTPEQGRVFADIVSAAGGHYLDLAIPAAPSMVRSGSGVYYISGDQTAYEVHRERFERIGTAAYVGDSPAAAYVSDVAVTLAYGPMAVALLQGLRICQQHGLPMEWFRETVLEMYPVHIRSLLDRVTATTDPSEREVEASVDVMADGTAEMATLLRELGLDAGMYDALHELFTAASEAGRGETDWTCVAEFVTTG